MDMTVDRNSLTGETVVTVKYSQREVVEADLSAGDLDMITRLSRATTAHEHLECFAMMTRRIHEKAQRAKGHE